MEQNSGNEDGEEEIGLAFTWKGKQGYNAVITVEPKYLNKYLNDRGLRVGWQIIIPVEYIKPMQCFNCFQYGHKASKCNNEERCSSCGEVGHKRNKCNENLRCLNCSDYNRKTNAKYPTDHDMRSTNCKMYLWETKKIQDRTDYGSRYEIGQTIRNRADYGTRI